MNNQSNSKAYLALAQNFLTSEGVKSGMTNFCFKNCVVVETSNLTKGEKMCFSECVNTYGKLLDNLKENVVHVFKQ